MSLLLPPPITNFVPFHPDRVALIREARTRMLITEPKPVRVRSSNAAKPKKEKDYSHLLPAGMDPLVRAQVLAALKSR